MSSSTAVLVVQVSCNNSKAVADALSRRLSRDGLDVRFDALDESTERWIVYIGQPAVQWLQSYVDEENNAAARRLALELPFPADARELTSAEVIACVTDRVRNTASSISPDGMRLIEIAALHSEKDDVFGKRGASRLSSWVSLSLDDALALRAYFGESVAMYFAWLHHYSTWLLFPAAVGAAVSLLDLFIGTTADTNPLLPIFSIAIMFWAIGFVVTWERRQNVLACEFHSLGSVTSSLLSISGGETSATVAVGDKTTRNDFHGVHRKNPFTGEQEVHYPRRRRVAWQLFSVVVTAAMLSVALLAQVCSLNLQGYMRGQDPMFEIDVISTYSDPGEIFDPEGWLFLVPVSAHAVCILALNVVYRRVAVWLTTLENYATDAEYERAMIVKRVFFEFIDCFAALFYVAFYRRDVKQLRTELVSLFTFDQCRRVLLETVVPYLWARVDSSARYRRRLKQGGSAEQENSSPQIIEEQLALEPYESFDDFMEMVMQFGYVTFFASAFPLAALWSVAGNVLERNSDLIKLRFVSRRPLPERCASIGPWVHVLRLFAYTAVLTNVAVFAYTSNQMRMLFPAYFDQRGDVKDGSEEYLMVALFSLEHVLLFVTFFVDWWMPRMPYSVASIMRQRHRQVVLREEEVSRRVDGGSASPVAAARGPTPTRRQPSSTARKRVA